MDQEDMKWDIGGVLTVVPDLRERNTKNTCKLKANILPPESGSLCTFSNKHINLLSKPLVPFSFPPLVKGDH